MKHLRPEQIFVMDNATFLDPPDNTREVLAEADLHEVNYSKSAVSRIQYRGTLNLTAFSFPSLQSIREQNAGDVCRFRGSKGFQISLFD